MKINIIFGFWKIIAKLIFLCFILIDVSAQAQSNRITMKNYVCRWQSDTVNINNKVILFEETPMRYFTDFKNLFSSRTEVIILETSGCEEKGYAVNFIIKDSIIYLQRITQKGNDFVLYSKDISDTTGIYPKKVSNEEIRARIERMTNRKFDHSGLLKADWISGEFIGDADLKVFKTGINPPSYSTNIFYKMLFDKGVLKDLKIVKFKESTFHYPNSNQSEKLEKKQ